MLLRTWSLSCAIPAIASGACPNVATSDFDGNCKSDVVWQNLSTSKVEFWLMNGLTAGSSGSPGSEAPPWRVIGVGDFDGDGKADLLWRNSATGALVIWFMNGAAIVSSGSPSTNPSAGWYVQAVGDFNGDGKADILFQNATTGGVVIWFMSGTTVASSISLTDMPGWYVAGWVTLTATAIQIFCGRTVPPRKTRFGS